MTIFNCCRQRRNSIFPLWTGKTDSGFRYNIVAMRRAAVQEKNGVLRLRLVFDRFLAEVSVNNGEQVMSACLYTPQEADSIPFYADGNAIVDIEKYDI